MRKIFLTVTLVIMAGIAIQAQKDYANSYKVYNNDKTLRLDFIEHKGNKTILYIMYTGKTGNGNFSGLLLHDFKLVAHKTGEIFRPVSSTVPTEADSKFFLHNKGTGIQLTITFNRIPVYVKEFDLVEPSTEASPTYNFTFRNLKFNEDEDDEWKISNWAFEAKSPKYIQVFTTDDLQLDVYIDEQYVGQLTKKFNKGAVPDCGKYGTLRIAFADDEIRKIKIVGRSATHVHTWNMEYRPLMFCQTIQIEIKK